MPNGEPGGEGGPSPAETGSGAGANRIDDAAKAETIARGVEDRSEVQNANLAVKAAEEIGLPQEISDTLRTDRAKLLEDVISNVEKGLNLTDSVIAHALKEGKGEYTTGNENDIEWMDYFFRERLMKEDPNDDTKLAPKIPGLKYWKSGGMDSGKKFTNFIVGYEGKK